MCPVVTCVFLTAVSWGQLKVDEWSRKKYGSQENPTRDLIWCGVKGNIFEYVVGTTFGKNYLFFSWVWEPIEWFFIFFDMYEVDWCLKYIWDMQLEQVLVRIIFFWVWEPIEW